MSVINSLVVVVFIVSIIFKVWIDPWQLAILYRSQFSEGLGHSNTVFIFYLIDVHLMLLITTFGNTALHSLVFGTQVDSVQNCKVLDINQIFLLVLWLFEVSLYASIFTKVSACGLLSQFIRFIWVHNTADESLSGVVLLLWDFTYLLGLLAACTVFHRIIAGMFSSTEPVLVNDCRRFIRNIFLFFGS